METRIVTLEPSEEPIVVSYEEAFGDYSEARGRGRARRLKRRQERQALRMQRIRNRQERRRARREGRRERMRERQERRTERMRLRQGRRTERRKMRLERKALGEEEVGEELPEEEEGGEEPIDTGAGAPPTETGTETGGYAPSDETEGGESTGGGGYTGGGSGYNPPTSEEVDYGSEDVGYSSDETEPYDEGGYDTGEGYDSGDEIDGETGESDYESGFTGDMGFDGVIELSEDDKRWNEYFSSAEGTRKINPKIAVLARQIEQHKEYITRLENALNNAQEKGNRQASRNISLMIQRKRQRLNMLESELASYSKFEGEYSEARGGRKAVARRKAEVRRAKKLARQERRSVRKASKGRALGLRKRPVGVTEVEQGLNPEFAENRIEVPAEEFGGTINTTRSNIKGRIGSRSNTTSNFSGSEYIGTGLIGLEQTDDYDAPESRKYDVKFSEFGGGKGEIDVKSIAIGVGVGVLAIFLAKKFIK